MEKCSLKDQRKSQDDRSLIDKYSIRRRSIASVPSSEPIADYSPQLPKTSKPEKQIDFDEIQKK